MPRRPLARPLTALALALGLAACASGPPPWRPFRLAAPGGAASVRQALPGVEIELTPLDAAGRRTWLREHLGVTRDPLAAIPHGERLVTIAARFRSTGALPVHVETGAIRLVPDRGHWPVAPLDYTRAWEALRPDRETGPRREAVDRFMRGLLDGPVDLRRPGETREGLLVFPEPDRESRALALEIPFVQVGSTTHRVRVPFLKVFPAEDHGGRRQ